MDKENFQIIRYDSAQYDFAKVVRDLFRTHLYPEAEDLSMLHDFLRSGRAPASYGIFDERTDQSSIFHKVFYEHMEDAFLPLYREFIKVFMRPQFSEALVYQAVPTFRVHLPDNVAVGAFHRDRDYHHQPTEMNYWVPLTAAFGTNTLWIESEEGKKDFRPHELSYGEILVFPGVSLEHGNKVNTTGRTRVGFDFRLVPHSRFIPSDQATLTAEKPMTIGGYFALCP